MQIVETRILDTSAPLPDLERTRALVLPTTFLRTRPLTDVTVFAPLVTADPPPDATLPFAPTPA